MTFRAKRWAVAFAFLASTAAAGELEDAQAAYQRKDFASALQLLRPMAEQGQPQAQYGLGLMMFKGEGGERNGTEAFRLILAGAEGGVAEAQALVAVLFYQGSVVVPKDYSVAARWARKASDQGNSLGMAFLGMAYLNGQGLQRDTTQARFLLKQAANQNNPVAQYELGKMMLIGHGIERDEMEGEFLLKRSAESVEELRTDVDLIVSRKTELAQWRNGFTRLSCSSFTCSGRLGIHANRLKSDVDSMRWVEVAARSLYVGFRSDLVYFYLGRAAEGLGDLNAAITYYNLAVDPKERGYACAAIINSCDGFLLPRDARDRLISVQGAQRELESLEALLLAKAEEERQRKITADAAHMANEPEARRLAEIASSLAETRQEAQQGSAVAQYRLAKIYFSGSGATADEKTGVMWLTKAAQQGEASAQYDLGERYRTGRSVPKDDVKSEMWFRRAVQQGHDGAVAGLASLQLLKQERAAAASIASKKQEADREEFERKRKLENAAKLKSL